MRAITISGHEHRSGGQHGRAQQRPLVLADSLFQLGESLLGVRGVSRCRRDPNQQLVGRRALQQRVFGKAPQVRAGALERASQIPVLHIVRRATEQREWMAARLLEQLNRFVPPSLPATQLAESRVRSRQYDRAHRAEIRDGRLQL
jgi:hypothetical protein